MYLLVIVNDLVNKLTNFESEERRKSNVYNKFCRVSRGYDETETY